MKFIMQIFVLLLITIVNYVSSDQEHCYVTFMESKTDDPYIDVDLNDKFKVEKLKIKKEINSDAGLSVLYDLVDQQALDEEELSFDLCGSDVSDTEATLLEILKQAMGLDSINCPIKAQTIEKPSASFNCEYNFGDTSDSARFVDFSIRYNNMSIFDTSVSILKPEDENPNVQ